MNHGAVTSCVSLSDGPVYLTVELFINLKRKETLFALIKKKLLKPFA